MPLKEEVLGQFLGDETFPVEWTSETEKLLFWVYDDLHCPKPLSPMYEDIGGWWLSCDHMFRRFGTPFATRLDLQEHQRLPVHGRDPGRGRRRRRHAGVQLPDPPDRPRGRRVRGQDRRVPRRRAAGLRPEVHRVVAHRFVPEMQRNFDYIEGMLDQKDQLSLAELAVLFEDAIDMHDRHWKIHWMLNFAQLSATLNLRAVMEETHGKIDEVLLGRLQNSANDRNWDKIRALWEMKEEVKADAELAAVFAAATARRDRRRPSRPASAAAGSSTSASSLPEGVRLARRLEPRVHLPDLPGGHEPGHPARPRPVRVRLRLPDQDRRAQGRHRRPRRSEILAGLEGEALEKMRAANEINLKMAPLTPDHHFYIDQGANAHVRLVLIAIGEKLVEHGRPRRAGRRRSCSATTSCAQFIGNPDRHRRAGHRRGGAGPSATRPRGSSPRTGSAPSRRPSSRSHT